MRNKYIYIGIAVAILVVLLCIGGYFLLKEHITYETLTSTDGKFSIEMPSNIEYKINSKENNSFTIDLYSVKDEMYIYATTIAKTREVNLMDIINNDKTSYLADKENIREDSGIIETSIKDFKAYEYSFVYYDKSYGKDFYCNTVWIETNSNLYILNFEVINDNAEKYKDIFNKMKISFTEL